MDFLLTFLLMTLSLLRWIVLANVIMSIIKVSTTNIFYIFSFNILNPIYGEIRKFPHSIGRFDLTPLILLIMTDIISYFLIKLIA